MRAERAVAIHGPAAAERRQRSLLPTTPQPAWYGTMYPVYLEVPTSRLFTNNTTATTTTMTITAIIK